MSDLEQRVAELEQHLADVIAAYNETLKSLGKAQGMTTEAITVLNVNLDAANRRILALEQNQAPKKRRWWL